MIAAALHVWLALFLGLIAHDHRDFSFFFRQLKTMPSPVPMTKKTYPSLAIYAVKRLRTRWLRNAITTFASGKFSLYRLCGGVPRLMFYFEAPMSFSDVSEGFFVGGCRCALGHFKKTSKCFVCAAQTGAYESTRSAARAGPEDQGATYDSYPLQALLLPINVRPMQTPLLMPFVFVPLFCSERPHVMQYNVIPCNFTR